jgi:hypothetical protein
MDDAMHYFFMLLALMVFSVVFIFSWRGLWRNLHDDSSSVKPEVLFTMTNPSHILYSETPPLLGGIPQKIARSFFEEKEKITWTNSPVAYQSTLEYINNPSQHEKLNYEFNDFLIAEINPTIGKGVFATKAIPQETVIGIYTGLLEATREQTEKFFEGRHLLNSFNGDSLTLNFDARRFRNATSYIQHAPTENLISAPNLATANIKMINVTHRGIQMALYVAKRNIEPNEQLLVDYGPRYWKHRPYQLFDKTGKTLGTNVSVQSSTA